MMVPAVPVPPGPLPPAPVVPPLPVPPVAGAWQTPPTQDCPEGQGLSPPEGVHCGGLMPSTGGGSPLQPAGRSPAIAAAQADAMAVFRNERACLLGIDPVSVQGTCADARVGLALGCKIPAPDGAARLFCFARSAAAKVLRFRFRRFKQSLILTVREKWAALLLALLLLARRDRPYD